MVPSVKLLDRDLAWLEFNRRVLHEAVDERTPLLERVKFLAIFSSNLDEFFMKRAERLQELLIAASRANGADPPLQRIRKAVLPLLATQAECYSQVIRPALGRHGIHLLSWPDLDGRQKEAATQFYHRNVFPILTPLKVDPAHPFPFISNLSTSLGVFQRAPKETEIRFARVKVPSSLPAASRIPTRATTEIVSPKIGAHGAVFGREGRRVAGARAVGAVPYTFGEFFGSRNRLSRESRLGRVRVVREEDLARLKKAVAANSGVQQVVPTRLSWTTFFMVVVACILFTGRPTSYPPRP